MSKKKNAKSNPPVINISLPNNLSKEEMQHLIAGAIVEAEEIKKVNTDKKKEELRSKHRGFKNLVKTFWNPSKMVEGNEITTSLLKLPLMFLFKFVAFILLLFGIACIGSIPISYLSNSMTAYSIPTAVFAFVYGCISILFAGIFRIASVEIDKTEDRTYIFGAFASLTALISVIFAIFTYVRGG